MLEKRGAYLRVFERRDLTTYAKSIQDAAAVWQKKLNEITEDAKDVTAADLSACGWRISRRTGRRLAGC